MQSLTQICSIDFILNRMYVSGKTKMNSENKIKKRAFLIKNFNKREQE